MAYKTTVRRVLPATLEQMLAHLKEDPEGTNPDIDALTLARYGAACGLAQHYTGRAIGLQTLEVALDRFPSGPIELPFAPAVQVNSIVYPDSDGVEQTIDPTAYMLDNYSFQNWVIPAYGTAWPDAYSAANAVKVNYQAGYDANTMPDEIGAALMLILGHLHENNQSVSALNLKEIPMGAKSLLDTVKVWSI